MTDLRKAAQQALEALEGLADYRYTERVKNTMASLRAALAEPEQEPVRLQCTTCGTVYADGVPPQVPEQEPQTTHWEGCEAVHPECRKPEQEPVAWMESPHGVIRANPLYRIKAPQSVAWSIPLYTAPAPRKPWVGLTVEEIFDCTHHITRIQQDEWVATDADLCEFAHIVEKQLQKKNGYGTWNKPLTKKQIDNICKSFRLGYTDEELVRAIERAHGIGDSNG